jgi:ketosteroid isomerase-like protein
MSGDSPAGDPRLEQALALLRSVLAESEGRSADLAPWEDHDEPIPPASRLSATDQLSWWFRPARQGVGTWSEYFASAPSAPGQDGSRDSLPDPAPHLGLRLLLAETEEELLDDDADLVVACLYDFIHAIGRRDVATAMSRVSADFHMLEDDQEVDRRGLESKIRYTLGSLRGWEFDVSLVEIPQPILHPDGILVYAETLIDAWRADGMRRSILERRVALFSRSGDGDWLLCGLPPVLVPLA